jgi:thiol-disulfide isomerase/thioredoxin
MRVRIFAAVAVVVGVGAALLAGLVLAGGGNSSSSAPVRDAGAAAETVAGPRVPTLAGTDPVTGNRVRLAQYEGRAVVLNVWASWCAPCRDEAPLLSAFLDENPDAVVVGIDLQDTVGGAKGFYDRFGWKHPSIYDSDGALAAKLGLVGLPTTIFLTRDHRESSRVVGPLTAEKLLRAYERARDS